MFDCSTCDENRKRANGCTDSPRNRDGSEYSWQYPPDKPDVEVDRCPARVVTGDVLELFRSANLAGGSISAEYQSDLPMPYIEALSVALYNQSKRQAHEMKQRSDKQRSISEGRRPRHG